MSRVLTQVPGINSPVYIGGSATFDERAAANQSINERARQQAPGVVIGRVPQGDTYRDWNDPTNPTRGTSSSTGSSSGLGPLLLVGLALLLFAGKR